MPARSPSAAFPVNQPAIAPNKIRIKISNLKNLSSIVGKDGAVALAMRDGPEAGVEIIDGLLEKGELTDYHLAYSARADFYRRMGRVDRAAPCGPTVELISTLLRGVSRGFRENV